MFIVVKGLRSKFNSLLIEIPPPKQIRPLHRRSIPGPDPPRCGTRFPGSIDGYKEDGSSDHREHVFVDRPEGLVHVAKQVHC